MKPDRVSEALAGSPDPGNHFGVALRRAREEVQGMAERTRNGAGGHSRHTVDGRRREQFASSVDWRCDLAGIGPDIPVRWVLNRDTKAIAWLNFREVEDGPWVLATKAEERDFKRKLLEGYPELFERDERSGVTTGTKFPAWAHTIHILRDDGRWEFRG